MPKPKKPLVVVTRKLPDTVETRIGTLKFFDGFPDKAIERK